MILPNFPKNCLNLKKFGPWGARSIFLLPANEVWGKVIFYTCLSFCSQGRTWAGTETGTPTPQAGTPPDQRQVHLHRTRGRYPLGRYTPLVCMLGDTGNKRAVRILLECILVLCRSTTVDEQNSIVKSVQVDDLSNLKVVSQLGGKVEC